MGFDGTERKVWRPDSRGRLGWFRWNLWEILMVIEDVETFGGEGDG